jgi:FlaA1/EpsC-like NDP-sugar epimerase
MVELSGLTVRDANNVDGDIELAETGLRPGEKLYEELLIGDNPEKTQHPRIMKAHEHYLPWAELEGKLRELEMALGNNNVSAIRTLLQQLVTGYQAGGDVVDWVHMERAKSA